LKPDYLAIEAIYTLQSFSLDESIPTGKPGSVKVNRDRGGESPYESKISLIKTNERMIVRTKEQILMAMISGSDFGGKHYDTLVESGEWFSMILHVDTSNPGRVTRFSLLIGGIFARILAC